MIEPSKCQTFGATENSVDARKTHCDTMAVIGKHAPIFHMFPTASRESRQLPTRVGCKLFDFGLRLILFHQISLSCAKDWSFRPSPHLFLEISQISQIQPPGDGSQQGWQVGDGRGRTVSYSGHLPLPRVPQGPQDVHPRSLQGQPGYARIQGVECCWHVPTCSSHEWIEYD